MAGRSTYLLPEEDLAMVSSDEELSDIEENVRDSIDYNIIVHLRTDCSADSNNHQCDKDTDGSDRPNSVLPKISSCSICKQEICILPTKLNRLVFNDILDIEGLARVFNAIKQIWAPKQIVLKSGGDLLNLPKEIGVFYNLSTLRVRHNQLRDLPKSLSTLTHLRVFDLAHNNFDEIPSVVFDLKSLVKLNLKDNKIRFISSSILELNNLESLDLSLNPMLSPSTAICEQGIQAVREDIKKHLNTAKAMTLSWGENMD